MPTERFIARCPGGTDVEMAPTPHDGVWELITRQQEGTDVMVATLDWADFQRLGLFVNRETRRHAKELQGRRGA